MDPPGGTCFAGSHRRPMSPYRPQPHTELPGRCGKSAPLPVSSGGTPSPGPLRSAGRQSGWKKRTPQSFVCTNDGALSFKRGQRCDAAHQHNLQARSKKRHDVSGAFPLYKAQLRGIIAAWHLTAQLSAKNARERPPK